jgi:hypothetical protein
MASAEQKLAIDAVQARSLGTPRTLAPVWESVLQAVGVVLSESSHAPAGQIRSTSENAINTLVRFVAVMEQERG